MPQEVHPLVLASGHHFPKFWAVDQPLPHMAGPWAVAAGQMLVRDPHHLLALDACWHSNWTPGAHPAICPLIRDGHQAPARTPGDQASLKFPCCSVPRISRLPDVEPPPSPKVPFIWVSHLLHHTSLGVLPDVSPGLPVVCFLSSWDIQLSTSLKHGDCASGETAALCLFLWSSASAATKSN